jgi:imidazolonepropionase-like amidohydrolase
MRHAHGAAHGSAAKHSDKVVSAANKHVATSGRHPHKRAGADAANWPLLPEATVRAIVEESHRLGKRTIAHVAEIRGVRIALDTGIDQWAHVPCMPIPDELLKRAAEQRVVVVTTIDTLSRCPAVAENARKLVNFGANLIYGAEIAHADVPWGIDAEELNSMRAAGMKPLDVLKAATSKSGEALGLAPLGTLAPGAPADILAVRGDVLANFKNLEYPDLVISGGKIVVDRFLRK